MRNDIVEGKTFNFINYIIKAKKSLAAARTDTERQLYERYRDKLDRDIDELGYQL